MISDSALEIFSRVYPFVAIAFILGVPTIMAIRMILEDREFYGRAPARRKKPSKTIKPVVAYKKAILNPSNSKSRILGIGPFEGLTGSPYGVDDETNSLGFHAYDNFAMADDHPQRGNVLLEVVLSGNMQRWDLGWIATHQRVLQVIVSCSYDLGDCERAPTRYCFIDGNVVFSCSLHGVPARLESARYGKRTFKMSNFYNHFPELKEAGVVIAAKDGANAFIPTSLGVKE